MVEMIVAAGSAVPTRRDAVQVLIPEAAGVEACWVAKGQAFRYVLPGTYALATYLVARVDPIQEMFDNAERLRKKGQWAEAAAAYAEVLQRDRRHWQSLRGYAFVLRELDRRGEAMCYVNESVRVNPRYSRGWRTKGALHRDAGNHAEGLACYERAIALDPEDPVARQNRINALGALGRKVEAEAARRELARMRDEK
jgi:tetratricopeptide (TPR) repeat protein